MEQSTKPRGIGRFTWLLLLFFAAAIASYAFAYVIVGKRMYPPQLAESFTSRPWGINPHALFGGIGLIVGALQFHPTLRRRLRIHRALGRVYVVACLFTGTAGVYMAAYSFGGWNTHLGFAALGLSLLFTTVTGYRAIRRGDIERHRGWMTRSYALMFAAVTLRLELPILIALLGFTSGYQVVAWLSWVPNLVAVEMMMYFRRRTPLPTTADISA